ncbi:hypothetical protein K435DRAFT_791004 [Dendrothele bispora CBS 962.96]|uniref:Uncharacterized protein n=1 Tax=Dendrothele bispora (strain CBS 962.96) TaxID=1314807 RepID=A0A4S8MNW3_DENBC|nr:hypothetical protein K435DRAFT_791004 [Dendrothele bispora CBS 962.96]
METPLSAMLDLPCPLFSPLKLSVSPSVNSSITITAHLVPNINNLLSRLFPPHSTTLMPNASPPSAGTDYLTSSAASDDIRMSYHSDAQRFPTKRWHRPPDLLRCLR